MGRTVRTETIVLWLCIAVVAITGLAPIAVMVFESVWHSGHFSLNHYRDLISTARFWPLFGNSLQLALATTTVCGLIGVPAGILFAKSDLPLRSSFMWLLTVPFVLPPYFIALGWSRVVARIAVSTPDLLFGFGGCVLVLSSVFLPIVTLLTFASASNVDGRLEEAGRLASGWPAVIRRITLPLSSPGIAFSLVLVFLLAAVAFLGVLIESVLLRDRVFTFRSIGRGLVIALGRWKRVFAAIVGLLNVALVIFPLSALFVDA